MYRPTHTPCAQWNDSSQTELLLKDGCYFVFGGDAGDKRDGTIRFVTLMIKLKQRYPDRVFLLVGNRDQNKLRLLSELTQQDLHFPELPTASWMTGVCRVYRLFIQELAVKQGLASSIDKVHDSTITQLNTMPNRLRWILGCTMGSYGDFEFRRQELALLGGKSVGEIDDDSVVSSFYGSVADTNGFMRQYMQLGQLAVVIDCTLYVRALYFRDILRAKFVFVSSRAGPRRRIWCVRQNQRSSKLPRHAPCRRRYNQSSAR
jgi:hypothetical protein